MAKLVFLVPFFSSLATPMWKEVKVESGSLTLRLENIVRETEESKSHPSCWPSSAWRLAWEHRVQELPFPTAEAQSSQEFQYPETKGGSDTAPRYMCWPHAEASFWNALMMNTDEYRPISTFNFAIESDQGRSHNLGTQGWIQGMDKRNVWHSGFFFFFKFIAKI